MYGLRSSGVSPAPSAGAGDSSEKGGAANSIRPMKNEPIPISTAVAHGTSSRWRRRVRYSTALAARDRTHAQSSSEPSWLDHIAVSL